MSSTSLIAIGPNKQRVGIVFVSFEEFVRKCSIKFNIKLVDLYVTLEDDTEVDEDYFEVLEDVKELHIKSRKGQKPTYPIQQLAEFLHTCLQKQPSVYDKVTQCLQKPNQAKTILGILAQVAESASSKRDDDTAWFKGLNTKFKTKEAVMRNSAETRMRSYLEQAKKALLVGNQEPNSPCKKAIEFFRQNLSKYQYNANYFDRTAQGGSLCNREGLFECEGPYNEDKCDGGAGPHFINPYTSRESRIIFSTWNLDHVIEKSRTILPLLKRILEGQDVSKVNLHYFHKLLFNHLEKSTGNLKLVQKSTGNLKLVHIACHDKRPHEAVCDHSRIYKKRPKVVVDGDDDNDNDVVDGVPISSLISRSSITAGVTTRSRSKRNLVESFESRVKRPRALSTKPLLVNANNKELRTLKKKA